MKLTKSPRLNYLLGSMGIFNYYDVINHLPYRYENLNLTTDYNFKDKQRVVLFGKVMSQPSFVQHGGLSIVTFDFVSNKHLFKVVAYNRPYLRSKEYLGVDYTLVANYDNKYHRLNLINIYKGDIPSEERIKPLYHLPSDYPNHHYISLVKKAFKEIGDKIYNNVPSPLRKKYHLTDKSTALYKSHFPTSIEDIKEGLKHLKYEEALIFSLKNKIIRNSNDIRNKIKKEPIDIDICGEFINSLPFKLSDEQYNAAKEIIKDMNDTKSMYRLLQGDVGSGKTIVSFLALYANYKRGDQGALMAPTDALARQHYRNAKEIFSKLGLNVALLVGSIKGEERKNILSDLQDGSIDIIIGTHALFSKGVNYSSLGLCIIDEQHRFGVNQRTLLASKGDNADLLMMSATPIPRSLALSIFGDLDISSINSFPYEKKKIITKVLRSDSSSMFDSVDYMIKHNRQVYIVAPLIDLSEDNRYSIDKLEAKYVLRFGADKVGVLHGKLSQEEKENVLLKFYNHEIDILVTTLVVEVGIDVKNASLMIIYDANNFGLASLHQLRGRIGRDDYQSYCLLTYDGDDEEELNKLKILEESNDGFYIAEQDLKMRGPGELSGYRQSGMPDFLFLNVVNDINIFTHARDDANMIFDNKDNPAYKWILTYVDKEIEMSSDNDLK